MNDKEIVLLREALDKQYDHVLQKAMRDRIPGEALPRLVIKDHVDLPDGRVITLGPFFSKEVALNVVSRFLKIARMVRFTVTVPEVV